MNAWLVALVLALRAPAPELVPAAELAGDVSVVVEASPPLPGATREQTAVVMLAIAWKESGWRRDVDELRVRGPGGACGLWQTIPLHGRCPSSRREAAALALELARLSFGACRHRAPLERLAAYCSGTCDRGLAESRARLGLAATWYALHPPPVP